MHIARTCGIILIGIIAATCTATSPQYAEKPTELSANVAQESWEENAIILDGQDLNVILVAWADFKTVEPIAENIQAHDYHFAVHKFEDRYEVIITPNFTDAETKKATGQILTGRSADYVVSLEGVILKRILGI